MKALNANWQLLEVFFGSIQRGNQNQVDQLQADALITRPRAGIRLVFHVIRHQTVKTTSQYLICYFRRDFACSHQQLVTSPNKRESMHAPRFGT